MALPTGLDRVQVMKQESTALGGQDADATEWGPTPIEPLEDALEAAGMVLQEPGGPRDEKVAAYRVSGHMVMDDANVPLSRKLVDQLLEGETITSVGTTTEYTEVSGDVTEELVKVGATPLRRTTYAYTSGDVTEEVRKVYAADGTTIIGQVTLSYSYLTDPPTITQVRNV